MTACMRPWRPRCPKISDRAIFRTALLLRTEVEARGSNVSQEWKELLVGGHWGFALFACWLGAFAEIRALHTVKSSNESIECAECGCGEELVRPSRWSPFHYSREAVVY